MIDTVDHDTRPVLALSGGVGGAKLALGLSRVLKPGALTVVANTGDDFEHLGLHISPDIDTLTYALAGVDNRQTGWGRHDETWSFMAALGELGGETWFKLGDRDLAVHLERTRRLRAGEKLSAITSGIAASFGIASRILPMTDDRVRTLVQTRNGTLEFQRYFVEMQCAPEVTGFVFDGAERARPHPDILAVLQNPQLRAIIICPSNPYISIDPILSMPELRSALAESAAPVIAISPIIGGQAVKGPTAKMMAELGRTVDVLTVGEHYRGLVDGFIVDTVDAPMTSRLDIPVLVRPVLMQSLADREELAKAALHFADQLACTREQPVRRSAR
jgi:LPPG:FO 2-phospho-L-lactate transferase